MRRVVGMAGSDAPAAAAGHFLGLRDGGCMQWLGLDVATMCGERLHEIVEEDIHEEKENLEWNNMMKQGFARMDDEVQRWN
ncbi:PPM-type phosphatase domain superfamily [Sesbania bispinosa]|nr:PPM-type phosphatase domain superfamily [Sesbania bispinosa]